jgi:hypothetical protein
MEFKLSKPFVVGEKTLEKLELKLDELTGADILNCEREAVAARGGQVAGAIILDGEFQAQVAARACGLELAALKKMNAADFIGLMTAVQGFLLGPG